MNIRSKILPHKHLRFSDSLIGTAGLIKQALTEPMTVDELWVRLHKESSGWPGRLTFTDMLLGVYVLFSINQIELLNSGRIRASENEIN